MAFVLALAAFAAASTCTTPQFPARTTPANAASHCTTQNLRPQRPNSLSQRPATALLLRGGSAAAPSASLLATTASLVKTIMGIGVLTLAGGMAAGTGAVPATVVQTLITAASAYSFALLGKTCAITGLDEACTFEGLWRATLGARTAWLVDAAIAALTFAISAAYLLCLGSLLSGARRAARAAGAGGAHAGGAPRVRRSARFAPCAARPPRLLPTSASPPSCTPPPPRCGAPSTPACVRRRAHRPAARRRRGGRVDGDAEHAGPRRQPRRRAPRPPGAAVLPRARRRDAGACGDGLRRLWRRARSLAGNHVCGARDLWRRRRAARPRLVPPDRRRRRHRRAWRRSRRSAAPFLSSSALREAARRRRRRAGHRRVVGRRCAAAARGAVALASENLGLVVGVLGSLLGGAIIYVVPAAMHLASSGGGGGLADVLVVSASRR